MFDTGEKKKAKIPPDDKKVKARREKGVNDHISKVFDSKKSEIDLLTEKIVELKAEKERNTEELNQNLNLLRSKAKSIEDDILSKKTAIADLQKEIAFSDSRLAEKKAELAKKNDELDHRQADLDSKERDLNTRSESLDRREKDLKDSKRSLAIEREEFIAERDEAESKIIEADKILADARKDAIERSERISDDEKAMAESLIEIGRKTTECNEKTKRAEEVLALQELVENKSAQLDKELKDLENERIRNRTLFKNIEEDTNQNAILRRNLRSREAELNRREKEIKALESTLVTKE